MEAAREGVRMNVMLVFTLAVVLPASVVVFGAVMELARSSASSRSPSRSASSGDRLRGRHTVRNERARAIREEAERERRGGAERPRVTERSDGTRAPPDGPPRVCGYR